mmetsp:Transcript_9337/g.15511  ORF Transcript_9337/g.15511 Transcript_9337/m.15511 type:complete len:162 (+) Transcript_9337:72-557(+)|eukprot:CAMPEP_0119012680 /NCGR_PEP_ID=MMETSP1176-20130426/7247_1 /TAXON_ID=265551 /ORGANISM="Synedropsis recta cf, Strain CCMP1620" /LENGTH=161 /DNA_ID=CAMNT_0006965683 /DNA_START=67 /DNA_END=552 /DNA_ORIENTATION=-
MARFTLSLVLAACLALVADAFAPASPAFGVAKTSSAPTPSSSLFMSDDFLQETASDTQERIQELVDNHPVLLFMKGSQLFPQCGFSNTAVQILNTFNMDFHSVDVLSDEAVRSGIKDFSQWPTIPQLYVAGEFVGGCDIMIEMFQQGEMAEMIEKAKADMV